MTCNVYTITITTTVYIRWITSQIVILSFFYINPAVFCTIGSLLQQTRCLSWRPLVGGRGAAVRPLKMAYMLLAVVALCTRTVVVAAAAAAAAPGCQITGWWSGGTGIVQEGHTITIATGDTGHGTISGHTLEMYFDNMHGAPLKGTLSADCRTIVFDNSATWTLACPDPPGKLAPAPRSCGAFNTNHTTCCAAGLACNTRTQTCETPPTLTKIHVVYMTHLDLGFTNTTRNVCDEYADNYFPEAFATAAELRKNCSDPKTCPVFRWTEFPWIIQEFLDGGTGCAHNRRTVEQVASMEAAIARDDIIWHANAVNFLTEVLDEPLWDYSLSMKDVLNKRFNKSHGLLTGKLADVRAKPTTDSDQSLYLASGVEANVSGCSAQAQAQAQA